MPDDLQLPPMPARLPPADLKATAEALKAKAWPVRERPFRDECEAELKYELEVRKGPWARCSYCCFLPHYHVNLHARPRCPECGRGDTICRWTRWAPAMIHTNEKARDWAMRICKDLGLSWPEERRAG